MAVPLARTRPSAMLLLTVTLGGLFGLCATQGDPCYDDQRRAQRCIPEFVNAAFNVRVDVTNTCGTQGPTEYCLQTGVTGAKKPCEYCDMSNPQLAHPPDYLTDFNNNDNQTWWQSETMYDGIQYPNQVNLTLSLGKAFDITYVRLKFHNSRPESFAIYKRTNETTSWTPYMYYSSTCSQTYHVTDTYVTREDETKALCTREFSDISPMTGGNVAFSTLEGRPSKDKFEYSAILQEFVTATDIRISLDRLNTFRDEIFGDPKVLKSYYYAISDFAVGGRCKCNGHASQCGISGHGPNGERRLECHCKHNTKGTDCELCQDFYNDQPWHTATSSDAHECKACNCNGRSSKCYFDQQLWEQTGHGGHCIDCADNTDGPNCERCKDHYYQTEDDRCVACNCDPIGARSLQCNKRGQCPCKPGVEGKRCDRCAANFYDFSALGCRPCGCNIAGSDGNTPQCDPLSGTCRCKENVEGQRCDKCKPGFFDMTELNTFGCLPCFCYGHSSVCKSSTGYTKSQIETTFTRDKERWKAVDYNGKEVSLHFNAVVRNIGVTASSREPVYFVAPARYLGDQRQSYNQYLSFTLRIGEEGPQATVEDVVLEGAGLRISLPVFGQGNPLPTVRNQEYKFQLHEHHSYGWNPRLTSRDFLSVLSNLTAIKIKGTYTTEGNGFLDDVKLDSAHRSGSGQEVTWIETCSCPESYVGQFCESCAPGFRHDPPGGGRFASCVPCNCHGHAEYCDSDTGRCICQHNTGGDNCERCAPGYYGNALQGTSSDCKPCPCPNQGACVVLPNEHVACLQCPPGYAGHRCDLCVDGYFGDPSGKHGVPRNCQTCDCNGNIDTNAVGNCNTTTGECLKCIYHTSGKLCDRCLPGFYGDALAADKGDCKACSCYPLGTVDHGRANNLLICDSKHGQCTCKSHVTGRQCDRCQDGFWNLDSGRGCDACNCNPIGSYNSSCDIHTGQCYCRPGVTGQYCDTCMPYHYGFSVEGCNACDCDPIGGTSLQCSPDGQCPCRPNVEGRRCERCKENKYNKEAGCVDCPPCYSLLQDAVNEHRRKLTDLINLLEEIERNPQVIDDVNFENKLREVVERVDDLLDDAKSAAGEDGNIVGKLNEIRDRIKAVRENAHKLAAVIAEADEVSESGVRNISLAEDVIKRIQEALHNIRKYLETEGRDALEKARERSKRFGEQSDRMSEIAREARELANRHKDTAEKIEALSNEALNTSNEANRLATDAISSQEQTRDDIRKLKKDLADTSDTLASTRKLANDSQREAKQVYDDTLQIYAQEQSIILPEVDILVMKDRAADIIDEAGRIKAEANDLIDQHANTLGEIEQKKKEAEELLEEGNRQQQITDEFLVDTDAALDKAKKAVESGEKTLADAQDTLETLKGFDKRVQESKATADEALSKVPEIRQLISDAETKTKEAENALTGAEQDAIAARDIAREAQRMAEAASKEAEGILSEADQTKNKAVKLGGEAEKLQDRVDDTAARMKDYENQGRSDEKLAKEALEKANQAKSSATDASKKVRDALGIVDDILNSLDDLDDIDTALLEELERRLQQAERELQDANLDNRMAGLRHTREQQKAWMKSYDEEIEQLKKDVLNIQAIRESLPDTCHARVQLEP